MGWKAVKEHYGIEHLVCVDEQGICIGSSYIRDLIVIGLDGVVKKRYDMQGWNEDLLRYQLEFDADPDKLRQLVQAQDTFSTSTVVYTYQGSDIIEKRCEAPGWPNVTHEGDLMYDNTFSTDKAKIVLRAKQNANAGIDLTREHVANLERKLLDAKSALASLEQDREKLNAAYPDIC